MELKDWAPWVGIAVSLIWNFANTVRGEVRANRSASLVEYKSLKTPVDAALSELRSRKVALRAVGAYSGDEFIKSLRGVNKDLSESFVKFSVALETLDSSIHSSSVTWFDDANIKWDDFISTLDEMYSQVEQHDREALLQSAITTLQSMIDATQTALENEATTKLRSTFKPFSGRGLSIAGAILAVLVLLTVFAIEMKDFFVDTQAPSERQRIELSPTVPPISIRAGLR